MYSCHCPLTCADILCHSSCTSRWCEHSPRRHHSLLCCLARPNPSLWRSGPRRLKGRWNSPLKKNHPALIVIILWGPRGSMNTTSPKSYPKEWKNTKWWMKVTYPEILSLPIVVLIQQLKYYCSVLLFWINLHLWMLNFEFWMLNFESISTSFPPTSSQIFTASSNFLGWSMNLLKENVNLIKEDVKLTLSTFSKKMSKFQREYQPSQREYQPSQRECQHFRDVKNPLALIFLWPVAPSFQFSLRWLTWRQARTRPCREFNIILEV